MLFLLRPALPAGLPDRDRHSPVHSPDRGWQPLRRGDDDFRFEHHGRHVRPRLPDRNALRGSLRARGGGGKAGRDRPIAALCDRTHDRNREIALCARRADRQAGRDCRRGAGGFGLRARTRLAGVDSTIFEPREKAGGLNEYGIAAYKAVDDFAAREVDFILSIGGIEIRRGQALGRDVKLDDLRRDYDAVFLGMGLGATNKLGLPGEAELET